MDKTLKDLRYSLRMLRKTPGTSAVAVIALAMGIGLTTLIFSIAWGALMRGLPFEQSHEIVRVQRTNLERGVNNNWMPIHDFEAYRDQQRSFETLAAHYRLTLNLSGSGEAPERLAGARVSPALLPALGERPVIGRWLEEADDQPGAQPVMMIGWQVWQDRFAGNRDVLGRTVRINGITTTIVGVMPPDFGFPFAQNAWLPLGMRTSDVERGDGRVEVTGRLRDGVTIDMARADLARIAHILETEYPETNEGWGIRVVDYAADGIGGNAPALLATMLGAALFVLLIACANVTNVLMGRAMLRGREVAVRTALGASRFRIAFQFLVESLALAAVGAVIGTAIAGIGIHLFNAAIVDTSPPFWLSIRLDGIALVYVIAATFVAALAAGAVPALQAARSNPQEILKDEGRGGSSFRQGRASRGLVIIEMALSVALLLAAGLMIKSVIKLNTYDLGFDPDRMFTARMLLPEDVYGDHDSLIRFADELGRRLGGIPGADAVALSNAVPGMGAAGTSFAVEGTTDLDAELWPAESYAYVSSGYFGTLSATMRRGRDFNDSDRDGSLPVMIVNEAFERKHMGGDGLGKRIRLAGSDSTWRAVVGIAPDIITIGIEDESPEMMFLPLEQQGIRGLAVLVRTGADPTTLYRPVRESVNAIDPDLPLYQAGTLSTVIADETWYYGVFGAIFSSFGLAALFLASVGLYGVMAFSVSQRTREMGIRMAVGAAPTDVLRLVLRQGMVQTAIGLGAGIVLGLALSSVMAGFLFRVDARDPVVLVGILVTLAATAMLACWIPARRATSVDPLVALRTG